MLLRPASALSLSSCRPAPLVPARPCSSSRLVCVAGRASNRKKQPQKPKRRVPKRGSNPGNSTSRLVDAMRTSMAMARIVDQRVPLFHEEFEAAVKRGDKLGLSAEEAQAVQHSVDEAWSTAHLMPLQYESMFMGRPDLVVPPDQLAARLGKVPNFWQMRQYLSDPMGKVHLKRQPVPYDPLQAATQSFSNTPCEAVHMLPGSTHVAVGFADLGELAAAVCRWGLSAPATDGTQHLAAFPLEFDEGRRDLAAMQAEVAEWHELALAEQRRRSSGRDDDPDSRLIGNQHKALDAVRLLQQAHTLNTATTTQWWATTSSSSTAPQAPPACADAAITGATGTAGQPLRWVGYDGSAYVVAKTAVLLQMMREGADTDAVLQVWYSSCWSNSTQAAFLTALAAVLDNQHSSTSTSATQPLSQKVLQLLHHWQQQPDVSLAQSRSSWLERVTKSNAFIGGFKRKEDRLALCRYIFTGELLAADTGSTAMCSLPPGFGKLADDESFLETIDTATLIRAWDLEGQPDIVSAGVSVLRRRIARLSELLQAGHVTAEVRHAIAQPRDTAIISAIHSLQPLSMSWSNVPDYMVAKDFHELAQRCSAPATVHFMHTMNWVRETKGACWVDYLLPLAAALEADDSQAATAKQGVKEMYNIGSEEVDADMRRMGVDKLILTGPVVNNPRNIIDAGLHYLFAPVWLNTFMRQAGKLAAKHASAQAVNTISQTLQPSEHSNEFEEADSIIELVQMRCLRTPIYGPFARTSATVDLAFVQYGRSR